MAVESTPQPAPAAQPQANEEAEAPPAPYVDPKRPTKKFLPNDPEFNQAYESIPADTKQRLDDLLRADFKYLEELELEKTKVVVPVEDALPEDVTADIGLEEDD